MQEEESLQAKQGPIETCEVCGARLIPLSIIHTERMCNSCGRTTYVAEPGESGKGIQVRAGDRAVIPAGAITLSLDRSISSGQFTKAGIAWYASMLLSTGAPDSPDAMDTLIDRYFDEALTILRQSSELAGFDPSTQEDVQAIADHISNSEQLRGSVEEWALKLQIVLAETKEAIGQNDTKRTAWAMNRLTNTHAMLVFKRDLEDMVWRGYVTQNLHDLLQIWRENQQNADEEFWQRTLATRPIVLSQAFAAPTVVLKDKAYVGGKGIENSQGKITDFLVANPLSENAALVEIKTPKTRLLGGPYRAGVYAISQDVSGAVVQVATQRDALLKEYYTLVHKSTAQFSAFSPHGLVIAGNLQEELIDRERMQSFELFRQGLRDVQVVTFDELFAKIESLLQSLQSD